MKLCAASGVVALLLTASPPIEAARSPVLGFARQEAGIFKVRSNGRRIRKLSESRRDAVPEFSPDGSKIAFLRDISDGDLLVVADADGSNERDIAYFDVWNSTCYFSRPFAWSPDGSQLVYQSNDGKDEFDWDLHVIDADGSNDRVVVSTDEAEIDPHWSPTGDRIAFTRTNEVCRGAANEEGERQDIFSVATDGSDERQLTDHPMGDHSPEWSPDGTRIAFVSVRDDTSDPDNGPYTSEVYAMDADGSEELRLTDDVMRDEHLSWSPNGRWIAFGAACDDDKCDWDPEIKKVRANGRRTVPLTDNKKSGEWYPEWSPDGRWIAYARFGIRSDNYDIWLVHRSGDDHRRVVRTRRFDEEWPTWR